MSSYTDENFWQSLQLYLRKAHVVNRRLAAVVPVGYTKWTASEQQQEFAISDVDIARDNSVSHLEAGVIHLQQRKFELIQKTHATDLHNLATESPSVLVLVNKMLAKNMKVFAGCHEIVVIGE